MKTVRFEMLPGRPILRGKDHYWHVIRQLEDGWAVSDIRRLSNGARLSTIRNFIRSLVEGGYVAEVPLQADGIVRYRLIKLSREAPSLKPDGSPRLGGRCQLQMWNLIRGPMGREGVSHADLALYASTEDVVVQTDTAARYLRRLAQAGYLLTLRAGKPGAPAIYRLKPAMNTGPMPPIVLRALFVFDQNREEAVGPVDGCEVAA